MRMKVSIKKFLLPSLVTMLGLAAISAAAAAPSGKSWTAPAQVIRAQVLVNEVIAAHPELRSITLHGISPGSSDIYTMFAGSNIERVNKASGNKAVICAGNGYTIIDPRRNKADVSGKFLVLMPLRDRHENDVACVFFAFKHSATSQGNAAVHLAKAISLERGMQVQIANHAALFTAVP